MNTRIFESAIGNRQSAIPSVSWFTKSWLPISVILISVLVLSFWHFHQTEWHPARRALSAVNPADFSWRNRIAAWEGDLQIMAEHPWFGAGWNQPEPLYEHYYLPPKLTESAAIQMNDYLMLGATLGIPALFCFAVYIGLSLFGGAHPPRVPFFAPSRKTLDASQGSYVTTSLNPQEVGCGAHPTTPGAGVLPKLSSTFYLLSSDFLAATCRAGAIVLLIGFWFDGGLFKLPTAATFWILLELGSVATDAHR